MGGWVDGTTDGRECWRRKTRNEKTDREEGEKRSNCPAGFAREGKVKWVGSRQSRKLPSKNYAAAEVGEARASLMDRVPGA